MALGAGTEDVAMTIRPWHRYLVVLTLVATFCLVAQQGASTQSGPAIGTANREAATRGEAWFYQRCSLCHMGRIVKDDVYQPMGPRLNGLLKGASPDREKAIREQIQRGSPRMPGFQYTFTPAEFEELMAYIKAL
jgi:mono/diheme cytochrome c family protein